MVIQKKTAIGKDGREKMNCNGKPEGEARKPNLEPTQHHNSSHSSAKNGIPTAAKQSTPVASQVVPVHVTVAGLAVPVEQITAHVVPGLMLTGRLWHTTSSWAPPSNAGKEVHSC